MSLVSRVLEENGISTVVIGSAKDIVEFCGVARFLFTDYPLGNPCGRPYDAISQRAIMSGALTLLEDATAPGTTVQSPLVWDESAEWKNNYARVGVDNRDALRTAGEARRAEQAALRTKAQATKA